MNRSIILLLTIAIVSFPILTHLTSLPIQIWDESRLAVSAIEMLNSKQWLIPTFHNTPDMWSTKPPLMIWLIAGLMKIIGPSELAIRLPAALAAIFNCFIWYWFIVKKFDRPFLALLSSVILVSSYGFMRLHCARTGDYDSLLAFCVSGCIIFYYLFLDEGKIFYLYLFFIFLIGASMTKGIAGTLMLPGLLIATAIEKKLKIVFSTRALYIGMVFFVFIVGGYYLLREHYNPGYLLAVWQNELGGRYTTVIEAHNGSWTYYLEYLQNSGFKSWFALIFVGVVIGLVYNKGEFKSLTIYLSISIISFYVIISGSKTQLDWYDMPAYPMLSCIVALLFLMLFEILYKNDGHGKSIIIVSTILLFLVLFIPYKNMVEVSSNDEYPAWSEENHWMAIYLRSATQNNNKIKYTMFIENSSRGQNLTYYFKILDRNNTLRFKKTDDISVGDTITVYETLIHEIVKKTYNIVALDSLANVKVYKVNGIKQ